MLQLRYLVAMKQGGSSHLLLKSQSEWKSIDTVNVGNIVKVWYGRTTYDSVVKNVQEKAQAPLRMV